MIQRRETSPSNDAIVIGGGVAGALVARELAEQDISVTVIEPDLPAPGKDPARQGALYIKPAVDYSPESRFAHQAFLYASEHFARLQDQHPDPAFWRPTGTLQLAWNDREARRQEKLVARNHYPAELLQPVNAEQASSLTGVPLGRGGLWFPRGGCIIHSPFRAAALNHPLVQTLGDQVTRAPVKRPTQWEVTTDSGYSLQAPTVVCAAGAMTGQWFPQLPLHSIRGQTTALRASEANTLKAAISGAGYALPPCNGVQIIGATFDRGDTDPDVRDASHRANLQSLLEWLPVLCNGYGPGDITDGWVGFRSTTPDHMPVAGQLAGLYLIAGLGGKGLAYAPILARLVANEVAGTNETILDAGLRARLAPTRFTGTPGP